MRNSVQVEGDIQAIARNLARSNAETEESIRAIYLFPNSEEIRLIEVDETTPPSDGINPFVFGPDRRHGLPYRMSIALIRPEENRVLSPPKEWGTWEDAVQIWPEAA